jgi:formylglycine-generating enzyme required for sulfatase activity
MTSATRGTAKRVRRHLSYANVMSTIAVFAALGGSAFAVARNSVGTPQLKKNAVKTKKIANSAVKTKKIADNAVTTPKLGGGAVTTGKLENGAVDSVKLANGAVNSAKLANAAVTPAKLACVGNDASDVMVSAGSVCIDRYEVSVWSSPTGGTQYGANSDDYPCNDNGQNCSNIYARSVAGVTPSSNITWFQAQQALANSGKRLPINAEWQQAVAGTPDSASCRVGGGSPVATGALPGCISNHGANDMVGNLYEWVGDWVPSATACPDWGGFSDDSMCLSGASTTVTGPGVLYRGGAYVDGTFAGPFAVIGSGHPLFSLSTIGFRGAR